MGSSAMKYGNRSDDFKSLFREYVDNDAGRLTHQKFYALVSAQNPSAVPKWMVIGSTNFWSGAMGCIDIFVGGKNHGKPKLVISNLGCSVFISKEIRLSVCWPQGPRGKTLLLIKGCRHPTQRRTIPSRTRTGSIPRLVSLSRDSMGLHSLCLYLRDRKSVV